MKQKQLIPLCPQLFEADTAEHKVAQGAQVAQAAQASTVAPSIFFSTQSSLTAITSVPNTNDVSLTAVPSR